MKRIFIADEFIALLRDVTNPRNAAIELASSRKKKKIKKHKVLILHLIYQFNVVYSIYSFGFVRDSVAIMARKLIISIVNKAVRMANG